MIRRPPRTTLTYTLFPDTTLCRAKVTASKNNRPHDLYRGVDPRNTLPASGKVALLGRLEAMARAADPRIIQVMAGLGAEYDVVLVAGSEDRKSTRLNSNN